MIAYIHSYTPNINHRQRSLFPKNTEKNNNNNNKKAAEDQRQVQSRTGGETEAGRTENAQSGRDLEEIRRRDCMQFKL